MPDLGKIAVFDLAGDSLNPVSVTVANNAVGVLIITNHMSVKLAGSLGVVVQYPDGDSFGI